MARDIMSSTPVARRTRSSSIGPGSSGGRAEALAALRRTVPAGRGRGRPPSTASTPASTRGTTPPTLTPPTPTTSTPMTTTSGPSTGGGTSTTVPTPRVGGLSPDGTAWVGGNPTRPNLLPTSPHCYRPTGWKEATKTYETATQGLKDTIDITADSKMTIVSFVRKMDIFLKDHGLDTVFYLHDSEGNMRYLIKEYAYFTSAQVKTEICLLMAAGDQYDVQNLQWSLQAVHNSLGMTLATSMEKHASEATTGPALYFQLMQTIQSTTSSALRTVEEELVAMRLSKEPGENVNTFTTKMTDKIRRLEGAGRLPDDLCQIMATCLMDSTVETFRLQFTQIFNECERNATRYDYNELIKIATSSYRTSVDRKMWIPNKSNKEKDTLPKALKAELGTLIQSALAKERNSHQASGQQASQQQKQRKGDCNHCGKPGHWARECPDKQGTQTRNTTNNTTGGSNNDSNNTTNKTHWYRVKPTGNDPHEKEKNGKKYYWCAKCTRWNPTHLTDDHKVGYKKEGGTGQLCMSSGALVAGFLCQESENTGWLKE